MLELKVLSESETNFMSALVGMGLSFNKTIDAIDQGFKIFKRPTYRDENYTELYYQMVERARRMAFKGGGHNKFLRAIHLDLIVKAPIDFWEEEATYTTVDANQSSSTMHTLKSQGAPVGFDPATDPLMVERYEELLTQTDNLSVLKKSLPCGYLYIRTIHLNYMTLQNIYQQRKNHKLPEWRDFCSQVFEQVKHPYFLDKGF